MAFYKKGYSSSFSNQRVNMVCSKCGAPMDLKTGKFGKFYACSQYPDCKNTVGFYDTPDNNQYTAMCINERFEDFIYSNMTSIMKGDVVLEFANSNFQMTENEGSQVMFGGGQFRIMFNQYHCFKTKFDILEQIIRKYVFIDEYFRSYMFQKIADPAQGGIGIMQTEKNYMISLDDASRKSTIAELSKKTSEIMNGVFVTVFGAIGDYVAPTTTVKVPIPDLSTMPSSNYEPDVDLPF